MKQVYLSLFGVWSDIIDQCDTFIVAKDMDGIMTYVLKDGAQKVRLAK